MTIKNVEKYQAVLSDGTIVKGSMPDKWPEAILRILQNRPKLEKLKDIIELMDGSESMFYQAEMNPATFALFMELRVSVRMLAGYTIRLLNTAEQGMCPKCGTYAKCQACGYDKGQLGER